MMIPREAIPYVLKGARKGQIIGSLGGATIGGIIGGSNKTDRVDGRTRKRTPNERLISGALWAGAGAYMGRGLGYPVGAAHHAKKWLGGYRPPPKLPKWLKGIKTKADATHAYKARARKLHPDLGGSANEFSSFKQEWDQHKDLFKEAMMQSFAHELEKIASLGAIIGGAAGYKLSPNTAKGKLVGTLTGAGVGAATGGALSGAKRMFVDDQEHRERQELYGARPVAGQNF